MSQWSWVEAEAGDRDGGLCPHLSLMTFPPTRQLLRETTPGSFCEVLEMGRLWSLMSSKERRFGSCCGVGLARAVGGWPGCWPRL